MDNTANLIAKLNFKMQQFIIKRLDDQGIRGIVPSHGGILLSLLQYQSLTMNELAKKISKDPSTVTCLVKKLTALGYTKITKDMFDKRANRVSLTDKGLELVDVIKQVSEKLYQRQYLGFSEDEIAAFRALVEKMTANFEQDVTE
ncbi:MAG: hypothetical protein ACFWUC_03025 [Oscillospiraceae bacterium]|jgi:MarR family transcriptional regulator, organic hydroperoxide resistance regulator